MNGKREFWKEKNSLIYCVLPAYNEEKGISLQLGSLKNLFESRNFEYKFVVINDGSTDRTLEEIKKLMEIMNIDLLNNKSNLGPGIAFKSAFEYILPILKDDDVVITMDCDNTLQLNTLESMINKINEGYDIALGSVFVKGGRLIGVPFLRKTMTYGANLVYRILFPLGVRDYTAFFRAMRGSALKLAYKRYGGGIIETKGFGCMAEMLIKIGQLPISITDVPMTIRYDLKTSVSKLKILKTIKEHSGIIRRNIFKFHRLYER